MKKTLATIASFFVLFALIASPLQIVGRTRALAQDAICVQIFTANYTLPLPDCGMVVAPLEFFASNSSDPPGLFPTNITALYNLPSSGGSGTIVVIVPYDDPTVANDLVQFDKEYGLPNPSLDVIPFNVPQGQNISSNINFTGEAALDVEWAHAIAPSANIMLIEPYNATKLNLLEAMYWAANVQTYASDVVSISMSLSGSEFSSEVSWDQYITSSENISFFAASGDLGENVSWPACSPNVVGVGGTTLNFNPNGSLGSEVVWKDEYGTTGGGISTYETEPSYQLSYGVQGSNGHRSVPDVSFDAGTGVSVYCSSPTPGGTGWLSAEGTSVGTPCWAAINSLNHTASNLRLYGIAKSVYNPASFRDITEGNNTKYNATTGYDFCTGLGSPLTSTFVSLLVGDVNLEGTVDIFDAVGLANAFNSVPGNSNWNTFADFKMDNVIDIYDALLLSAHFGQNYTGGAGSGMLGGTLDKPATLSGGTSVLVNPSQTTVFGGEVFTVNVDITSVTDLQGWEFKLYWNSTILNCTNVVNQVPTEWQDNSQTYGPGLEPSYNATHARYWRAEVGAYPAPSFNGSTTFATITFKAMQPGTTFLTLTDVKLANSTAQPIDCSTSSGSVEVSNTRYMRGDTQTVNSLNAYLLNATETSTVQTDYRQTSGPSPAYWGIRAWMRCPNGTEVEIQLSNQTGTPKAIVVATSYGTLELSATTAVTAKTWVANASLVVRVYFSWDNSSWTNIATFTTEQLTVTLLKSTNWTVYYDVYHYYNFRVNKTFAYFYWGAPNRPSRIENLQYG